MVIVLHILAGKIGGCGEETGGARGESRGLTMPAWSGHGQRDVPPHTENSHRFRVKGPHLYRR